ncbi:MULTISPECIES: nitroreductase family protein [Marinimicrobium]|mgnify:CR=1 FL=1|uniref:Putative NAD(P)H nitroreductase n=1 Tax=Marinimicrobium koreense TaxID=306545 RepID=A0A3N1P7A1_9GAMM|nr:MULTISPECIES: nitroreductase family protein [Marinimicrobium]ROQ20626.1 nitroreductase [Marinimicrobium koreense]
MHALDVLHQRVSSPKLTEPAPTDVQRDAIYRAALRAADHGLMQPWRFLVIEDEGLDRLGDLFVQAMLKDTPDTPEPDQQSLRAKPRRAPLILVAIAACRQNPKVPHVEQLISAGAAVQNMLNAAFAQGVGAFWRTGAMTYHPVVKEGLGVGELEQIVGFLYLGTPAKPPQPPKSVNPETFFHPWPGQ